MAFSDGAGADTKARVVSTLVPAAQQLAVVARALPSVRDVPKQPRLGILVGPRFSGRLVAEYEAAAKAAGFSLVKVEVQQRSEVGGAARELLDQVQAHWLAPDATVVNPESFRTLIQLSAARKVPVIGFAEAMAKAGGVVALQPAYSDLGKSVGVAARQLMEGKPASLTPREAMTYLNAMAANLLGFELPEAARSTAAKTYG